MGQSEGDMENRKRDLTVRVREVRVTENGRGRTERERYVERVTC